MIEKYVLFTNLEWVTIGNIRTYTHALLVDSEGLPRQRQCKVRGFGTDPAWPTFDIFVDSVEYTLEDAQGNLFQLKEDGSTEALVRGGILKLKGGPELRLTTQNREASLDIQTFEGEDLILGIWDILKKNVAKYWRDPNMPTLAWRSADTVRAFHGVVGNS